MTGAQLKELRQEPLEALATKVSHCCAKRTEELEASKAAKVACKKAEEAAAIALTALAGQVISVRVLLLGPSGLPGWCPGWNLCERRGGGCREGFRIAGTAHGPPSEREVRELLLQVYNETIAPLTTERAPMPDPSLARSVADRAKRALLAFTRPSRAKERLAKIKKEKKK